MGYVVNETAVEENFILALLFYRGRFIVQMLYKRVSFIYARRYISLKRDGALK